MKLNWPNAIVLSFLLFFGFIGYWVLQIETHEFYKYELVHENYYEEEIHYNLHRQAEENAQVWKTPLQLVREAEQLKGFPLPKNTPIIVEGYFPAAQEKDFKLHLKTDTLGVLSIPNNVFIKGNWVFIFSWTVQQKEYRINKKFYY